MIRTLVVGGIMGAAVGAAVIGGAPVALAERPYANCTEAHDDGRWDIPQDDAAYWDGGDRDNDGYACDS
jgi:Excalibur calcium-binding domain